MGDGTGTRGAGSEWPTCLIFETTCPALRAGLDARARLTSALDFGFAFLEETGVLFLRLDEALEVRWAVADEGFRDEERADRGAFFLFKSFSLLESRDPSQVLGNSSGTTVTTTF
jgi:hypothetical protein